MSETSGVFPSRPSAAPLIMTKRSASPSLADLDLLAPDRKPDWRYRRVLAWIGSGRMRRNAGHDHYVRLMREWLVRRHLAGSEGARRRLEADFAGPAGAMWIHEKADPMSRLRVECRILAGESDAEIGAKEGVPPESVLWYEKLFFHVRDRIEASDWIVHQVLEAQSGGFFPTDEQALKAFAYFLGPAVLDALLTGFLAQERRTRPGEPRWTFREEITDAISLKAAMAVARLDPRHAGKLSLLKNYFRMQRDEQRRSEKKGRTENHAALIEGVEVFLKDMEERNGNSSRERPAGEPTGTGPAAAGWPGTVA